MPVPRMNHYYLAIAPSGSTLVFAMPTRSLKAAKRAWYDNNPTHHDWTIIHSNKLGKPAKHPYTYYQFTRIGQPDSYTIRATSNSNAWKILRRSHPDWTPQNTIAFKQLHTKEG